jgi:hypothetical protein
VEPTPILATDVVGIVWLFVWVGLALLNLLAWIKIITKAGYSALWILFPVSAVLLWILTLIISLTSVAYAIASPLDFNSAGLKAAGVLALFSAILFFASWILFLLFAFSDWPVLRGSPAPARALGNPGYSFAPGPPGLRPPDLLPPPPRAQDPGWYQVGATNNDQGYWDGRAWTAKRRWEGAGWTEVPLAPSDPGPAP